MAKMMVEVMMYSMSYTASVSISLMVSTLTFIPPLPPLLVVGPPVEELFLRLPLPMLYKLKLNLNGNIRLRIPYLIRFLKLCCYIQCGICIFIYSISIGFRDENKQSQSGYRSGTGKM